MIDRCAVFDEYLRQAGTAFATFMGTVSGAMPVACPVMREGFNNTHKAIIFHPESERSHISGGAHWSTFLCKCYGGSAVYSAARAVAGALYDHCHNKRGNVTGARIKKLAVLDQFQGADEPEGGWPVQFVRIQMVWEVT